MELMISHGRSAAERRKFANVQFPGHRVISVEMYGFHRGSVAGVPVITKDHGPYVTFSASTTREGDRFTDELGVTYTVMHNRFKSYPGDIKSAYEFVAVELKGE